jgi:flagellar assembly protein FliH
LSKVIPGDSLTYERWELPSMDSPAAQQSSREPPGRAESPLESLAKTAVPPTLKEIETLQRTAQEEGFSSGYQEGHEEGRKQGYDEGHQEGYTEGYQKGLGEGLAAAQEEVKIRLDKLEQILTFLTHPLDKLDTAVEEELSYLATEIARQLVRRELKTAPGQIVAVIREAVGLLPVANQAVRIHLHPEDARLVKETLALDEERSSWQLIEDHTLSRGGCVIHTENSRIDASVEKRLGAVIATVLGEERGSHHDPC